jgi:very-short-patch-repair endonuclease
VNIPLDRQCELVGLPKPSEEFRFAPPRRWRFDYAFKPQMVAVEIEGGAFTRGRHTRGAGFIADMEKYNTAVALGWKVLRFTPSQVKDATALGFIENVLKVKP